MATRLDKLTKDDVILYDDGTLDTVLTLDGHDFRYSDTSSYRDVATGELDLDAFLDDEFETMVEAIFLMEA